jgi:hypothetical protein
MRFTIGSIGPEVRVFQRGLSAVGYPTGPADGHYGEETESAVIKFQQDCGLYSDGIAGRDTLGRYNSILDSLEEIVPDSLSAMGIGRVSDFKIVIPPPTSQPHLAAEMLTWTKCPADKVEGYAGYSSLRLRKDVADKYLELYSAVSDLGGVVTTAGGRRSLASKSSPSRSKTSMHYLGRAFDLALPTAMQNLRRDPYLVERDYDSDNGRKWTLWCRTDNKSVPKVEIKASYVTAHKNSKGKRYTQLHDKTVSCRAFNFTELAKSFGFHRISGRRSFFRGGSYSGAEWWHFSYLPGLEKNKTTFGSELLKTYTVPQCEDFVYWDLVKDYLYGKDWF